MEPGSQTLSKPTANSDYPCRLQPFFYLCVSRNSDYKLHTLNPKTDFPLHAIDGESHHRYPSQHQRQQYRQKNLSIPKQNGYPGHP